MNFNKNGEFDMLNTGKKTKYNQPACVVGIGASAGGLEALQQFLTFLPRDTDMAYVIIQHLSPDHKSLLREILGKYTSMPVVEAVNGMRVEKNHIYMIPPKYNLEIESDELHLTEYNHQHINHPIDIFFRSLAQSYENRSVAVILSGTGSDGTNGIRAIKEQNGVIIVQTPESAKFDGMPNSAISTGFVDLILNPDSIAREMSHISASMNDTGRGMQMSDEDLMSQVFSILKNITNINYTYYKQTTILRRIERRIVVTHNRNLREYVNYLTNNPEEAKILAKEVLIGVTSFFRDTDYFDVLKTKVITELLQSAAPSDQIRVWVAGCSTGEEAYSIAILFAEAMDELGISRQIKIFATDLDADAIATASRGVYGDNIIEDVSVPRLSRYFTRKGNHYVINHEIRKMIVFAQHNVFQDPPFGTLDLISCRNLLIYFQGILQRKLFAIFHMALKDKGYLFLGRSESVIDYDDVFRVLCANEKIFVHNASGKAPVNDRITYSMHDYDSSLDALNVPVSMEKSNISYTENELDTKILETFMPACVIVDEKNKLTHTYGDCSKMLRIPLGSITLDIFSLVRTDLKIIVSKVLKESRETRSQVAYRKIPVKFDDQPEYISVIAEPIQDKLGGSTGMTAIVFLRSDVKNAQTVIMDDYKVDTAAAQRISSLEKELNVANDHLKNTVTELEAVNAELQAANEELLTANEELQSSNEELQSVNEELYTVNSEYQSKVSELALANDDMANFLSTTMVGIIMVDQKLNIRKFAEYIAKEFTVAEQDVGRSLRYIAYNFATIDLMELSKKVLRTMRPEEHYCAAVTGKTYLINIAPYRAHIKEPAEYLTVEEAHKDIHGLVITFVDTTKQINDKRQIEEMANALRAAVRQNKEKETFLSQMSHDMRTPMTAINGLIELTLQEDNLTESLRDNLEKIRTTGDYLMTLIDEVLETSQINAGKVVSVSSAVHERQAVENVSTIIAERAKEAGIHFELIVRSCEDRYVMMDLEHMERILMNLLSNALKFTPEGGKVTLKVDVSYMEKQVDHTYTIMDNGIGISPEFQQRMFLPFEQEKQTGGGLSEGTGLGLYICRNLVDLLGGTIDYSSKPGEGAIFIVHMQYDLATDDQIQREKNKTATFEEQVLHGKTVLLVEDNNINAEVIMKILETKGMHSELARDGQEAIDIFKKKGSFYYQAILMDIMMPVKGGIEAAREIRSLNTADAEIIPIIALTADVYNDSLDQCLRAGMNAVLTKPIDIEKLGQTLAKEFVRIENESLA